MTKITAIIPTFNEESNIQRALDSVAFADEIIVIDSFSTDKTVEIVKKSNAVLLQRTFDDFSTQKNYAIQQANNEWIFLLDADEEITESLQKEIQSKVEKPNGYNAFYVYRNFFFKQKKLHFSGWQRDKVIRLFKKGFNSYEGKVHEKIITNGEIGFLKGKLNHYSYKNYNQYKKKLDHYAQLQAAELMSENKVVTPYHLLLKPIVRFLIQFIIKLGILDGIRGFIISYVHSIGVLKRYTELLKLKYSNPVSLERTHPIKVYNESSKDKKDVSIIIVNYKSWKDLKNCLEPLVNIESIKFSFETIVVDNFSNDGKLEDFSKDFKTITFIQNSGNNGFANGCNVGAEYSNGEYLFFLNPDTLVDEKAIEELLETAKNNSDYGIVSCNQKNIEGREEEKIRIFPRLITLFGFTRALYRRMSSKYKQVINSKESVIFPDWVSGSVVFISKKWFEKINKWNEDYWMYFEDVDLSKKVSDNNGKVALLKNVDIIHNHGGASRINIKTSALTKSEVLISRHIYISTHFKGISKFISQLLLIIQTLVIKTILGTLGLIFCFIPKAAVQWYLFVNMIKYYLSSIISGTWLSVRSMNFNK